MQTMDKYYYFVAQLPFLKFAEKGYVDEEYFLTEAKKWLRDKDFIMLSQVNINFFQPQDEDNKVLRDYKDFERALRQKIASFRASKGMALPKEKVSPGFILGDEFIQSLRENTPLEIEVGLLKLRWQFIENLEEGHIFDLEALILYFLKLQIQKRLFTFNKEKGTAVFDELSAVTL